MDNFMDKLAQKFSAQEMIKANSEADTNEMKRLRLQVAEYEKIMQEMRKLNYKNTELSEKLNLMIGENADKLQNIKEDEHKLMALLRDITDEQTRNREADIEQREEAKLEKERAGETAPLADTSALVELIEGKFQNSDDFMHKESVKVYRNVQAVIVDEVKRHTETVKQEQDMLKKKLNTSMCISVIAAVASICNLIIWGAVILFSTGVIK